MYNFISKLRFFGKKFDYNTKVDFDFNLDQLVRRIEFLENENKRLESDLKSSLFISGLLEPLGIFGTNFDIFIENSLLSFICCSFDGNVMYWNKLSQNLFGWNKYDVLGKDLSSLLFYKDKKILYNIRKALLDNGVWEGELCCFTMFKQKLYFNSKWVLVSDYKTGIKYILIFNLDLTDLKKLTVQYSRSQKLESIGMLASGIAHDLNNVLSPFFMAVKALQPKVVDDQSKLILSLLDSSAHRGASLVRQILSFTRGVDGKKLELDVRHLLSEIETLIRDTFPKNIKFSSDIQVNLRTVYADPTQIYQVILNLCLNARDAMAKGGVLTVKVENCNLLEKLNGVFNSRPGHFLLFTITDTGIGISKKIIQHIFEPFFTTKEQGKGTGLGLSNTLSIVKDHSGFMSIESNRNVGSSFKIYLPSFQESGTIIDATQQSFLLHGRGETILILDEDPSIRNIGKAMLTTYGYNVLASRNSQECISYLARKTVDIHLIILDLELSDYNGFEFLNLLKEKHPSIKFIVLSSSSLDYNKNCRRLTPIPLVMKPFSTEILLNTLASELKDVNMNTPSNRF